MIPTATEVFAALPNRPWKLDPARIEGVMVRPGVVFGTGGGRELRTDVFLPPEGKFDGPRPAIAFFHGGGWRAGDRTQLQRQAALLAAKGMVTSCSEYRLSGEAIFPAAVEDCKCAVRALRAWADELNVDRERIGAAGSSAGGHLAAMIATTAGVAKLEGDGGHAEERSDVQVAALLNPATDLVNFIVDGAHHPVLAPFLGGTLEEREAAWHMASPIEFVSPSSAPCIIFHGTGDVTVPVDQATRFAEALRAAGVEVELHLTEGAGHGFANGPEHFEHVYAEMERFLLKHLG